MERLLKFVGIATGCLVAYFSLIPIIKVLACPGFFEEGCGTNEYFWLALSFVSSATAGVLACWLCNRIVSTLRH